MSTYHLSTFKAEAVADNLGRRVHHRGQRQGCVERAPRYARIGVPLLRLARDRRSRTRPGVGHVPHCRCPPQGGIMRILRSAAYTNPVDPPVMTVARDCDLVDTLEGAQQRLITPGVFIAFDIFELPDDTDIRTATFAAGNRITDEMRLREANQALSYHWNGEHLRMVSANGALCNDKPAPLTAEECGAVLAQLAQHPNRKPGVTIIQTAQNGEHVKLVGDKVTYEQEES